MKCYQNKKVLIQYWENCGNIFFFSLEGELHYQLDLFLERATFPNVGKVEFKIEDEHEGGKELELEEENEISEGKFKIEKNFYEGYNRSSFGVNINKLFEGITISYVENNIEKIKPFKPFAIDHNGGIISLYYCGNKTHGDIIIY